MLADRVADVLEAAEGQHLAGRAAGDDGDGAHLLGQLDEDVGRVGVDVGLLGVVDDRGQGAVEVEADDQVVGGPHQGGVLLLTRGRAELHGPNLSSPTRTLSKQVGQWPRWLGHPW